MVVLQLVLLMLTSGPPGRRRPNRLRRLAGEVKTRRLVWKLSLLGFVAIMGCAATTGADKNGKNVAPAATVDIDPSAGASPSLPVLPRRGPAATRPAPSVAAPRPSSSLDERGATTNRPPAEYKGPDACKVAINGGSPVDRACSEGGIEAAKVIMKALVTRARAGGAWFHCADCHADDNDYSRLTTNAHDDFKQLVAAAK